MQENMDAMDGGSTSEPPSGKKAPSRALVIGLCLAAALAVGLGAWALTSGPLSPVTAGQGSEEGDPSLRRSR